MLGPSNHLLRKHAGSFILSFKYGDICRLSPLQPWLPWFPEQSTKFWDERLKEMKRIENFWPAKYAKKGE
jgi:hypothetical protein